MSFIPFSNFKELFLNSSIGAYMFGGRNNYFSAATDSIMVGGNNNANYSDYGCIFCGSGNTLGGKFNSIINCVDCSTTNASDPAQEETGCTIVGSLSSFITDASTGSTIIGTFGAQIENGYYSTIVGGTDNELRGTFNSIEYSGIFAGTQNSIGLPGSARGCAIVAGQGNTIANNNDVVEYSGVFGGQNNDIKSASGYITRSCTTVGSTNTVISSGSTLSSLISCDDVDLVACTGVTVLSMSGGTLTQKSYTTYVNSLNIKHVLHLTPLGADPGSPSEGDIYYRSGVGIKFYDGSVWRTLDFT